MPPQYRQPDATSSNPAAAGWVRSAPVATGPVRTAANAVKTFGSRRSWAYGRKRMGMRVSAGDYEGNRRYNRVTRRADCLQPDENSDMPRKDAHCSHCGHAFVADAGWPRTCAGCGTVSYRNPTPVAVVIQPVDDG